MIKNTVNVGGIVRFICYRRVGSEGNLLRKVTWTGIVQIQFRIEVYNFSLKYCVVVNYETEARSPQFLQLKSNFIEDTMHIFMHIVY